MAEEKTEKKKSNKLIFIIIGALVLAGGGAGAFFMFGKGEEEGGKKKPAAEKAEKKGGHGAEKKASSGGHGGGHGGGEEGVMEGDQLIPFDSFIVNLADPRGDRFLKATISCVIEDPEIASEVQHDRLLSTRIRDKVIQVLSSKTFEDISSTSGKETLRTELAQHINKTLPNDAVKEVLFTEFIVQ